MLQWSDSYTARDTYPSSCDQMYAEHYFYGRRLGLEDAPLVAYGDVALYSVAKYTGLKTAFDPSDPPLLCNFCTETFWGAMGVESGIQLQDDP